MASVTHFALFALASTILAPAYATDGFCKRQAEVLEECGDNLESTILFQGMDSTVLCDTISSYRSCLFDTNSTCPDLPILNDAVFIQAIQNLEHQFSRFCPSYREITNCSSDVIHRLVTDCSSIINVIQPETDREEMCELNGAYLSCLNKATSACLHDAAFLKYNVPMSILTTSGTMKAFCDDIQGDAPGSHIIDATVTDHPICSDTNIQQAVDKCIQHLQQPPEVTDVNGCGHQKMFLECIDHLYVNCPGARQPTSAMVDHAQETFDVYCSSFTNFPNTCPPEIVDNDEDVVSYCLKDLEEVSPADSDYCNKLSVAPDCILNTYNICQPMFEQLEHPLEMLHDLMSQNCGKERDQ